MRRLSILAALSLFVLLVASPAAFAQTGSGRDLDCADFDTQEEAQAVFDQDTSDPNGLDGTDNDGLACESLPSGAAEDGTMMGTDTSTSGGNGGTTTDLDCADFATQEEAQANLNANPSDPNGLDADNDGLACEEFSYPTGGGNTDGDGASDGGGTTADLDCIDFATQAEAQATYDADPSDPNGLDADADGIACETTTDTANTTEFEDGTGVSSGGPSIAEDDGATGDQYADDNAADDDVAALPDTGGPALLLPAAALLMVVGGLSLAILRRRQ